MQAQYLFIKYNHIEPYRIRFAYLIKGDEIDLLEFEMQKGKDILKDALGNLIYLYAHYLGDKVSIKLNKETNTHYMDWSSINKDKIDYENRYKSNFWVYKYQLTGERNWIINKLIAEPGTTEILNEKSKIPVKLKKELLILNYN